MSTPVTENKEESKSTKPVTKKPLYFTYIKKGEPPDLSPDVCCSEGCENPLANGCIVFGCIQLSYWIFILVTTILIYIMDISENNDMITGLCWEQIKNARGAATVYHKMLRITRVIDVFVLTNVLGQICLFLAAILLIFGAIQRIGKLCLAHSILTIAALVLTCLSTILYTCRKYMVDNLNEYIEEDVPKWRISGVPGLQDAYYSNCRPSNWNVAQFYPISTTVAVICAWIIYVFSLGCGIYFIVCSIALYLLCESGHYDEETPIAVFNNSGQNIVDKGTKTTVKTITESNVVSQGQKGDQPT